MSEHVFKEHYEITGTDALAKARAFETEREKAFEAHWALVKDLGGVGFRPDHGGQIKSVMFKNVNGKTPSGWRKIGTENGNLECAPARNTAAGRALTKKMALVMRNPSWRTFADGFGWEGRSPMAQSSGRRLGMLIYFGGGLSIDMPRKRFFLIFPRTLDDGWVAPQGLTQIRESEMLRAIEDHNAALKATKAKSANEAEAA